MRSRFSVTVLMLAMVFAWAPFSHAALIHVSKSYPTIAEVSPGSYEFQVNNLKSIKDAWTWGGGQGLTNNLQNYLDPASGQTYQNMTVVIFEDSGVYNLADDFGNTGTDEVLFLDWWGAFYGTFPTSTGGFVFMAATGQSPTIDYSTAHGFTSWGAGVQVILSTNHQPGTRYIFSGINFVQDNVGATVSWGNGVYANGGNAGFPLFRDCTFVLANAVFGSGGGQQHGMAVGPEFYHCAFKLVGNVDTGTYGNRLIKADASSTFAGGDGSIDFENCSFISDTPAAIWSIANRSNGGTFPGGGDTYTYDKCLFYEIDQLHSLNWDVVTSFTNNLTYPAFSGAVLIQGETGTVEEDPLLANINSTDFWMLTASSPAAFSDPSNNIGFDLTTAGSGGGGGPVGTPVTGLLGLALLVGASAATGAVAMRRKK